MFNLHSEKLTSRHLYEKLCAQSLMLASLREVGDGTIKRTMTINFNPVHPELFFKDIDNDGINDINTKSILFRNNYGSMSDGIKLSLTDIPDSYNFLTNIALDTEKDGDMFNARDRFSNNSDSLFIFVNGLKVPDKDVNMYCTSSHTNIFIPKRYMEDSSGLPLDGNAEIMIELRKFPANEYSNSYTKGFDANRVELNINPTVDIEKHNCMVYVNGLYRGLTATDTIEQDGVIEFSSNLVGDVEVYYDSSIKYHNSYVVNSNEVFVIPFWIDDGEIPEKMLCGMTFDPLHGPINEDNCVFFVDGKRISESKIEQVGRMNFHSTMTNPVNTPRCEILFQDFGMIETDQFNLFADDYFMYNMLGVRKVTNGIRTRVSGIARFDEEPLIDFEHIMDFNYFDDNTNNVISESYADIKAFITELNNIPNNTINSKLFNTDLKGTSDGFEIKIQKLIQRYPYLIKPFLENFTNKPIVKHVNNPGTNSVVVAGTDNRYPDNTEVIRIVKVRDLDKSGELGYEETEILVPEEAYYREIDTSVIEGCEFGNTFIDLGKDRDNFTDDIIDLTSYSTEGTPSITPDNTIRLMMGSSKYAYQRMRLVIPMTPPVIRSFKAVFDTTTNTRIIRIGGPYRIEWNFSYVRGYRVSVMDLVDYTGDRIGRVNVPIPEWRQRIDNTIPFTITVEVNGSGATITENDNAGNEITASIPFTKWDDFGNQAPTDQFWLTIQGITHANDIDGINQSRLHYNELKTLNVVCSGSIGTTISYGGDTGDQFPASGKFLLQYQHAGFSKIFVTANNTVKVMMDGDPGSARHIEREFFRYSQRVDQFKMVVDHTGGYRSMTLGNDPVIINWEYSRSDLQGTTITNELTVKLADGSIRNIQLPQPTWRSRIDHTVPFTTTIEYDGNVITFTEDDNAGNIITINDNVGRLNESDALGQYIRAGGTSWDTNNAADHYCEIKELSINGKSRKKCTGKFHPTTYTPAIEFRDELGKIIDPDRGGVWVTKHVESTSLEFVDAVLFEGVPFNSGKINNDRYNFPGITTSADSVEIVDATLNAHLAIDEHIEGSYIVVNSGTIYNPKLINITVSFDDIDMGDAARYIQTPLLKSVLNSQDNRDLLILQVKIGEPVSIIKLLDNEESSVVTFPGCVCTGPGDMFDVKLEFRFDNSINFEIIHYNTSGGLLGTFTKSLDKGYVTNRGYHATMGSFDGRVTFTRYDIESLGFAGNREIGKIGNFIDLDDSSIIATESKLTLNSALSPDEHARSMSEPIVFDDINTNWFKVYTEIKQGIIPGHENTSEVKFSISGNGVTFMDVSLSHQDNPTPSIITVNDGTLSNVEFTLPDTLWDVDNHWSLSIEKVGISMTVSIMDIETNLIVYEKTSRCQEVAVVPAGAILTVDMKGSTELSYFDNYSLEWFIGYCDDIESEYGDKITTIDQNDWNERIGYSHSINGNGVITNDVNIYSRTDELTSKLNHNDPDSDRVDLRNLKINELEFTGEIDITDKTKFGTLGSFAECEITDDNDNNILSISINGTNSPKSGVKFCNVPDLFDISDAINNCPSSHFQFVLKILNTFVSIRLRDAVNDTEIFYGYSSIPGSKLIIGREFNLIYRLKDMSAGVKFSEPRFYYNARVASVVVPGDFYDIVPPDTPNLTDAFVLEDNTHMRLSVGKPHVGPARYISVVGPGGRNDRLIDTIKFRVNPDNVGVFVLVFLDVICDDDGIKVEDGMMCNTTQHTHYAYISITDGDGVMGNEVLFRTVRPREGFNAHDIIDYEYKFNRANGTVTIIMTKPGGHRLEHVAKFTGLDPNIAFNNNMLAPQIYYHVAMAGGSTISNTSTIELLAPILFLRNTLVDNSGEQLTRELPKPVITYTPIDIIPTTGNGPSCITEEFTIVESFEVSNNLPYWRFDIDANDLNIGQNVIEISEIPFVGRDNTRYVVGIIDRELYVKDPEIENYVGGNFLEPEDYMEIGPVASVMTDNKRYRCEVELFGNIESINDIVVLVSTQRKYDPDAIYLGDAEFGFRQLNVTNWDNERTTDDVAMVIMGNRIIVDFGTIDPRIDMIIIQSVKHHGVYDLHVNDNDEMDYEDLFHPLSIGSEIFYHDGYHMIDIPLIHKGYMRLIDKDHDVELFRDLDYFYRTPENTGILRSSGILINKFIEPGTTINVVLFPEYVVGDKYKYITCDMNTTVTGNKYGLIYLSELPIPFSKYYNTVSANGKVIPPDKIDVLSNKLIRLYDETVPLQDIVVSYRFVRSFDYINCFAKFYKDSDFERSLYKFFGKFDPVNVENSGLIDENSVQLLDYDEINDIYRDDFSIQIDSNEKTPNPHFYDPISETYDLYYDAYMRWKISDDSDHIWNGERDIPERVLNFLSLFRNMDGSSNNDIVIRGEDNIFRTEMPRGTFLTDSIEHYDHDLGKWIPTMVTPYPGATHGGVIKNFAECCTENEISTSECDDNYTEYYHSNRVYQDDLLPIDSSITFDGPDIILGRGDTELID